MIPIVPASDTAFVDRLLAPRRDGDRALHRRVARIVEDVRLGGDAALRTYAEQLDGLTGAFEVPRAPIARGAEQTPPRVRTAIRAPARHIARVARAQLP